MKRLSDKLTYANVISTLCLVLLVGRWHRICRQ